MCIITISCVFHRILISAKEYSLPDWFKSARPYPLLAAMEEMTLNRVQARDRLILDVEVWMKDPNDHAFAPRLVLEESMLQIHHEDDGAVATHELSEDELELAQRDMTAEMRVKFMVRGMHEILIHQQPILADGNANVKKLAEPRWKTILPINS